MTQSVLILAPDDTIGRLTRALAQGQWSVHTAANVRDVRSRVAKNVTAILAPLDQYREATEMVARIGSKAKVVATVPFSDPSGEDRAAGAGAFSVLRRPFAPNEVLQVLAFASSRRKLPATTEIGQVELHGVPA